ncbi:MAG: hypothetical protein ACE5GE_08430 [Phycisphaerae bacterium]
MAKTGRWVWVWVLAVGLAGCGVAWAGVEGSTSKPAAAVEIAPGDAGEKAEFEGWVLSGEVYAEGVSDEAGHLAYVDGRIEALLSAGERAASDLQKVNYQLAAANWMLSRQIEPRVSRLLLGIEASGDRAGLMSGLEQARFRLDACRTALEAIPPADESEEEEGGEGADPQALTIAALERSVESLSAYAAAIGAIWRPDEADGESKAIRRTASALGVFLEDDRPEVAQLASLYRALLYGRMGRLERALSALEPALAPLPAESRAAALYNRVLRCQLLAQEGGFVVAWSLLLRLEERVTEWFSVPRQVQSATRAVGLARLEIARQWEASLRAQGAKEEADWCRQSADALEAALQEGGGRLEVLRLGLAVPMMVESALVEGVELEKPIHEVEGAADEDESEK